MSLEINPGEGKEVYTVQHLLGDTVMCRVNGLGQDLENDESLQ